jgi:hypothetical protein
MLLNLTGKELKKEAKKIKHRAIELCHCNTD